MPAAVHRALTREPFPRMLLGGAAATAAFGVVSCAVLAVSSGLAAAANAGAAAALVAVLFIAGALGVRAVLGPDARAASSAVMGALVVYLGQLILGTALVLVLRDLPGLDRDAIAIGGLGAAVAWQIGMIAGFASARISIFDAAPAPVSIGGVR